MSVADDHTVARWVVRVFGAHRSAEIGHEQRVDGGIGAAEVPGARRCDQLQNVAAQTHGRVMERSAVLPAERRLLKFENA